MPDMIPTTLSISQLGLSIWAATRSYAAITRLNRYEEMSETAAQYSYTAEHELHKTRTTHTSGAAIIAATLLWSIVQLTGIVDSPSPVYGLLSSSGLAVAIVYARQHISKFWSEKTGVPLVVKYNEGIELSKQLVHVLGYMNVVAGVQAGYYAFRVVYGMISGA